MLRIYALAAALALASAAAWAQNQQDNYDTGGPPGGPVPTPLVTLTAAGAGTTNGSDLLNYAGNGASCVFRQSASGGTPSSTFKIQGKDQTSGLYYDLIVSAAVTGVSTNRIAVRPGITATSNVTASDMLPFVWRVSVTVAGSSPSVTGTIGCSVVR